MNRLTFLILGLAIFISCESAHKEDASFRDLNKNNRLTVTMDKTVIAPIRSLLRLA